MVVIWKYSEVRAYDGDYACGIIFWQHIVRVSSRDKLDRVLCREFCHSASCASSCSLGYVGEVGHFDRCYTFETTFGIMFSHSAYVCCTRHNFLVRCWVNMGDDGYMESEHPLEVGDLVRVDDGTKQTTGFILQVYEPDEDNLYKDWSTRCGGYEIQHPDGIFIFCPPEWISLLARG